MSATNPVDASHLTPNTLASAVIEIPFLEIRQSPLNPRKHFDPQALEDLAASIRLFGIEQAITVRPKTLCSSQAEEHPECRYEIVMGERRYRAALMAGLTTIPARVVECTDDELIARALTENVERQDLSCIEIAHGYRALVGQGWKQEQIAQKFHTDQPQVSLILGLLRLPEYVQGLLAAQRLTKSHGIALLPLAEEEKAASWLAKRAIDESLSEKELREQVRQKKSELEQAQQPALFPKDASKPAPTPKPATPDVKPDFTPADAKREFEESQKPDPDVPSLSSLPPVAATAPAPEAVPQAPAQEAPTTPAPLPERLGVQHPVPQQFAGARVATTIPAEVDDWLFENDLTLDAALLLLRRPQLTPLAHKCLKALTEDFNAKQEGEPVGLEVRLESILIVRAQQAGFDIDTLREIPE